MLDPARPGIVCLSGSADHSQLVIGRLIQPRHRTKLSSSDIEPKQKISRIVPDVTRRYLAILVLVALPDKYFSKCVNCRQIFTCLGLVFSLSCYVSVGSM